MTQYQTLAKYHQYKHCEKVLWTSSKNCDLYHVYKLKVDYERHVKWSQKLTLNTMCSGEKKSLDDIKSNIMTKLYDDWEQNVATTMLTRFLLFDLVTPDNKIGKEPRSHLYRHSDKASWLPLVFTNYFYFLFWWLCLGPK